MSAILNKLNISHHGFHFIKNQQVQAEIDHCPCPPSLAGMDLMMSESPGSVMERVQTRKYLPQAVPSSMLLPE